MKKERNVGLITFPISEISNAPADAKAGNMPFSNLVDILRHLFDNLYVITGNEERVLFKKNDKMHVSVVPHRGGAGFITRIIRYILTQVKQSYRLVRLSKHTDIWLFYIGAEALVLPLLAARLFGKRTVLFLTGFGLKAEERGGTWLDKTVDRLKRINLALSDKILVCAEQFIADNQLVRYRHKTFIAHEFFLDFDKFRVEKPLPARDNLVGFIGRLSEVKGITNFARALPLVVEGIADVSFLIGGDGERRQWVQEFLAAQKLMDRVKYAGWIPYDELPRYLNDLKVLVLPSYSEGLSFITREAMACGTPVLATAVGGVPDVIKDGDTGFILEDNSPQCIARNIIRALKSPDLARISEAACALVRKEYTLTAAVKRLQGALMV